MPTYDASHFNPPAPVARAILRNTQSGATISDVLLLVDSGVDVTLLPRKAVEGIGVPLTAGQGYELMGFDGSKSLAPAVTLDMIFLKRIFRGQYLLIEEERGILGRDILNNIALLLDGPGQRWEEQTPSPADTK
jgi:hypothetical protein